MDATWASLRGTGRGRALALALLLLLLLLRGWGAGAGGVLGVPGGCPPSGLGLAAACGRLLLGPWLLLLVVVVAGAPAVLLLLLPGSCLLLLLEAWLLLLPLLLRGASSSTSHQSVVAGGGAVPAGAAGGGPRLVRVPGGGRGAAPACSCMPRCFAAGGGRPCEGMSCKVRPGRCLGLRLLPLLLLLLSRPLLLVLRPPLVLAAHTVEGSGLCQAPAGCVVPRNRHLPCSGGDVHDAALAAAHRRLTPCSTPAVAAVGAGSTWVQARAIRRVQDAICMRSCDLYS
jgi:hypothetical protein